jgi:O-antigen/teichoic acid export membrane protein
MNRTVHHTLIIIEYPQVDNFGAEPLQVFFPVCVFNAHQHEQPHPNASCADSVNLNMGAADPLNNCTHTKASLFRKVNDQDRKPYFCFKQRPLGGIRQLANQTIWYGLSNILGRFINYLITPLLLYIFDAEKFGEISILFALAAFLNILFSYGMETAYFRFNQLEKETHVFNTTLSSLLISTMLFGAVLVMAAAPLAATMQLEGREDLVVWTIAIVALDTLALVPFAQLRHQGRPRKFALLKLVNILINVTLILFFLKVCKPAQEAGEQGLLASLYLPGIGIGYVFLAQLAASLLTLLFLFQEWKTYRPAFDKKLFLNILAYSTPLIVVGFGGMINETIDRFMLIYRFNGTVQEAKIANGIYSANYKLAVLIVIFIQTFRMGAEPFFFKQAGKEEARQTYARIMNLFVIACCACFLAVVLFLDVWKYFMGVGKHPEYLQGLVVVPLLMLAKIFLGIYYNLSIWYKLTNRNGTGALITVTGAVITLAINYLLIPSMGFLACALATVCCYGSMMLMSYFMGQKHYKVPYDWKKALGYMLLSVLLFSGHSVMRSAGLPIPMLHALGAILGLVFALVVLRMEKEELIRIPVIKKLYR